MLLKHKQLTDIFFDIGLVVVECSSEHLLNYLVQFSLVMSKKNSWMVPPSLTLNYDESLKVGSIGIITVVLNFLFVLLYQAIII